MDKELEYIVTEMVKAGESEDDIALVIQNYKPSKSDYTNLEKGLVSLQSGEAGDVIKNYAGAGMSAVNRGLSQVVTAPMKVLGAVEETLGGVGYLTKTAKGIEGFVEKINPRYENVDETYQAVFEGLGQAGGMIASGGLGAAARTSQTAQGLELAMKTPPGILGMVGKSVTSRPSVIGGSMTAAPEWEQAKAAGLSDEEAFGVLVQNYLVGQTEAIPLQRMFGRLNKITGNKILNTVKAMGIQGFEEGLQEGIQTYLTNEIARGDYDPDRDPLFQVLESAGVGGLVGLILPAVGSVMSSAPAKTKQKLAEKIIALETNKNISEVADTGNPETNAIIDEKVNEVKQAINVVVGRPDLSEGTIDERRFNEIDESMVQQRPVEEEKVNTPSDPVQLVNTFDESGVLLGATEESKTVQRGVAVDQIADFLRGKVTTRKEIQAFQQQWNAKRPERPITNREVIESWNLIRSPRPDKGTTVTQTVAEALKEQVKTFYRGVTKGVRKGQKLVNERLIPKVQEALKGAKLTTRQTSAILNRLKSTNLFTPGSFSKLNTFIDKVTTDVQYAETLAKSRSLQKRVRKFGRQKNEKIPVNYKILAREFSKINPNEVEDLDEYLDKSSSIVAAFRPVNAPDYAPVNVTETEDYIDKMLENQEEAREKTLKEAEQDLTEIREIAKNSQERLSQYGGALDSRGQKSVDTINKIDVDQLDGNQLKRYIKIVDNIVENDDLSGETFVENIASVQNFVKEFDTLTKGKRYGEIGLWGRTMYNLSNMAKRIYQNENIEAFFRSFIHGPILTAGSQSEVALVEASKRFDEDVKRINKKYKIEMRDINNKADMMVFSLLYQMDNDGDFAKMHRNIVETINRHKQVGNEVEAKAWEQAYGPFKGIVDLKQIREIVAPSVYELWKTFGSDEQNNNGLFTNEIAEEQARVSKEVYNREYATTPRYTPIVQHDVNTLYKTAKTIEEGGESAFPGKVFDPKQARTAKRRTLNLAPNKVYTLEPYTDWILRYGETIYDNKASKAEAKMAELIRHPDFTRLVGGNENALALAGAFERMISIQRGTNRLISDNEAENFFTELAKTVRSIGTVKALASVSQAVKQSTVSVKLFTNLMAQGDADVLPAAIGAVINMKKTDTNGVKKLLDQSTLVSRGLRMGGTDRGTSEAYKLQRGARKWFYKFLEGSRTKIDKRTRASLSLLVKPDLFNARVAFISYYLQNLKQQGVRDVDLNKEHERLDDPKRQQAMAYAENMVEKTQTASNPAAMSDIQSQTKSKGWEFVKTVFLPFSTFDADFKARLTNEISAMRRSPSSENLVRVGGTVGEALTFAALNAFVLYWYKEAIRNAIAALTGVEREKKEPEKVKKEQRQQFINSITNSLNPLAIGTVPQDIQANSINEIGYQIAKRDNPELTKKEWMKENALVYEPREGNLLENLGAYSTGLSPLLELMKTLPQYKSILGEPVKIVDAYGNEKMVTFTKDQQKILVLKGLVEAMTLGGLTEADVANAVRAVYREQLKEAEPATPAKAINKKQYTPNRKTYNR